MIAPILLLGGLVAVAAGALLLRRAGDAWRVGRLLAGAPQVSLEEVVRMAGGGRPAFIRTHGRVASDEEFPDENERPLVYRRRRLQHADGRGGWITFDDERLAVPFGVEDGGAWVGVDVHALGDGLVVMPREAAGSAVDLPQGHAQALPAGLPPATPVRLLVEQVSAVEHATVAGVPRLGADGQPQLSAGLGRPLILATLELDEAMRLLASGRRRGLLLAGLLLVVGLGAVAASAAAWLVGL